MNHIQIVSNKWLFSFIALACLIWKPLYWKSSSTCKNKKEPHYVTGHITQATISTPVFQSCNPWNSSIPLYSSTGFPEQRTLLRITRCFRDLFFYLPAFYLLLLSLAPLFFKNPYCTGLEPVHDWKQYRHLQPRQSLNSWKYSPGTDSGRKAYFKD